MLRFLVLTASFVALAAPTAEAANLLRNDATDFFGSQANYGSSGVVNNKVNVAPSGTDIVIVEQAGGSIGVQGTCANPDSDNTATCPAAGVSQFGVYVGDGNDVLTAPNATFGLWVRAGAGADELHLGQQADTAQMGAGDDVVHGGLGNDSLSDDDYAVFDFSPGTGIDQFFGEQGNDVFGQTKTVSADTITGGDHNPGGDTVNYAQRNAPVTVVPESGGGDGEAGEGDVVTGVENAIGGSAGDTLTGGGQPNVLQGSGGNDVLTGNGATDTLDGGSTTFPTGTGDDLLNGGPGTDIYLPRDGRDTITYAAAALPVTATLDGAANDGVAGEAENLPPTIEIVEGGPHDDKLTGNGEHNELRGAGGADQLFGESGRDTLTGGAGTDTIEAGADDDVVFAADGEKDAITCGSGADEVTADKDDAVAADCETVDRGETSQPQQPGQPEQPQQPGEPQQPRQADGPLAGPKLTLTPKTLKVRRGKVAVRVACPASAPGACKGTLTLRTLKGRRLGRKAFVLAAGTRGKVTLKVGRRAKGRCKLVALATAGTSTAAKTTLKVKVTR